LKKINLARFTPGLLSFFITFVIISQAWALEKQSALVHEALTGDTVRLKGGKTLKYAGLAAPPLQSLVPLVREYGENSLSFNKSLVDGQEIWIEWDNQIRDSQNNLIGYVFLSNGTFVNLALLRQGHAKARIVPPNQKYQGSFRRAELDARRDRKGLWEKEPKNPFLKSEYIGHVTTKRYYFPTSPELEEIPQSQLVTFRSKVEAKAAGYRPCHSCREEENPLY